MRLINESGSFNFFVDQFANQFQKVVDNQKRPNRLVIFIAFSSIFARSDQHATSKTGLLGTANLQITDFKLFKRLFR